MNNITVAGPLGRDSEMRYLPNGDPALSFSVADSQGKEKPTIWWNCSLLGKRAESLQQYLNKGQQVAVSGSLSKREWTDKEGQKREALELRVNDISLQGGRSEPSSQQYAPAQRQQPAKKSTPQSSQSSDFDDFDDGIPF